MEKQNLIPFNISAEKQDKTVLVRIIGHIGYGFNIEEFRRLIDKVVAEGCTSAHLYINSPGGSCFDAEEIMNVLTSNFQDNITGEGGALVASAASYIATHCKTFVMPVNGKFMVHRPRGSVSGTYVEIGNYLKLIQDIDKEYFQQFKSKAKDVKDFTKKWNAGDNWMTATEAKEAGFITNVRKKINIDKEAQAMINAAANNQFVFPENHQTLTPESDVKQLKMLAVSAGLNDNVSFETVNAAIKEFVIKNNDLTKVNKTLQDKVSVLEKVEKDKKTAEANSLIDSAVKDGRLNAEGKDAIMKLFERDHEAGKQVLAAIPKQESIVERIRNVNNKISDSVWEERQKEIETKNKKY